MTNKDIQKCRFFNKKSNQVHKFSNYYLHIIIFFTEYNFQNIWTNLKKLYEHF